MPKKITKKTTSNTPDVQASLPDVMPDVGPLVVTVALSKEEMISLAQILMFSKNVFAEMALSLEKEGKSVDAESMNARSVLSQLLFTKFKNLALIGEPESRQVH